MGTIRGRRQRHPTQSVHPHGRGDNVAHARRSDRSTGSPPRAWGQLLAAGHSGLTARFTPTGVGTIWTLYAASTITSVHPHGRGDNAQHRQRGFGQHGSPPRAWGQCLSVQRSKDGWRFTPTGVGTILFRKWCSTPETVHPHGRGDNTSTECGASIGYGSPPRAWGQCPDVPRTAYRSRFTPTGVGTID